MCVCVHKHMCARVCSGVIEPWLCVCVCVRRVHRALLCVCVCVCVCVFRCHRAVLSSPEGLQRGSRPPVLCCECSLSHFPIHQDCFAFCWSTGLQRVKAPTEKGKQVGLGRGRELIFRMKPRAKRGRCAVCSGRAIQNRTVGGGHRGGP